MRSTVRLWMIWLVHIGVYSCLVMTVAVLWLRERALEVTEWCDSYALACDHALSWQVSHPWALELTWWYYARTLAHDLALSWQVRSYGCESELWTKWVLKLCMLSYALVLTKQFEKNSKYVLAHEIQARTAECAKVYVYTYIHTYIYMYICIYQHVYPRIFLCAEQSSVFFGRVCVSYTWMRIRMYMLWRLGKDWRLGVCSLAWCLHTCVRSQMNSSCRAMKNVKCCLKKHHLKR